MIAACSARSGRTALAIEDVRWHGTTSLLVTTECATDLEADVGPDRQGADLLAVTVWGEPAIGRCRASSTVEVPAGTTRIVDGTTSQVIDLPPPPTR